MAVRLWDTMERSQVGPYMEEKHFVKKVLMPGIKNVVKKYGIQYDPAQPVPADDDLADRIWQAAVELFLTVGTYNQDTHRVIHYTEAELKEALYAAPDQYIVGGNHDQRRFGHRHVEGKERPFIIMSPDITYDENIFFEACLSYLKEPLLDGICSPLLGDFMGRPMTSHFPSELGGSMRHAMTLRETARLAGRPDVFFVAVGTAESDMAQISVSNDQWGVRAGDGRLCGAITEFMTNNQMLNKAVHYNQMGNLCAILPGAIYGGYAGGAEGTSVLQAAYHLQGLMVYGASFTQSFPFHLQWGTNTGREMLWIVSTMSQAVSRNSHLVMDSNCFANAGPMTDMLFYEAAAHALASVVSGNNLWTCAPCRNKIHNHGTPLEARMAAEVAHAAVQQGMTREQASDICNRLLAKYEEKIPVDNYGVPFQEAYDVLKCSPKPEYLDLFYQCKQEIASLGVNFLY